MTRSVAEVERVLALAVEGRNASEIARITGISRGTIKDWLYGRIPAPSARGDRHGRSCRGCDMALDLRDPAFRAYAYLLGMYLGDGSIASHPRGVFRLRIVLDRRYPGIVAECARAMRLVMPASAASVYQYPHENADQVSSFSKHWPCLFPQHGPGKKHERPIRLVDWQIEIADRHPWQLLRGLIHSDGCRFMNPIKHPKKTYIYPRYAFSNRSNDIRGIFCKYRDEVGVEWRRMNEFNISVARRDSVALMDRYIGPKA